MQNRKAIVTGATRGIRKFITVLRNRQHRLDAFVRDIYFGVSAITESMDVPFWQKSGDHPGTLGAEPDLSKFQSLSDGWRAPLRRKHGHAYYCWKPEAMCVFYTRPQLERLHRHLPHPSARKLYELLRRAVVDKLPADTKQTLQEISKACETCNLYSPRQITFQVRDGDKIKFNHRVLMDIMFLQDRRKKSRPVLHIIDAGTRFSAAAFLPKSDCTTVWNTFIKAWSAMYIGFPESILTDQGSVFVSKEWKYNCDLAKINLFHSGTESHNSLGIGKRYHSISRTIYQKVRCVHPEVPCDVALSQSVQAMNSTVGPHGLVPSLLVFGVLLKLPEISGGEYPSVRDRLRAAMTARSEYERETAKSLVQRGLRSIPPPAANHKYQPGDFAYVYREGLRHYTGPHMVASVDGKCIRLHLGESTGPRAFNIAQTRPAALQRHPTYDEQLETIEEGHKSVMHFENISTDDPRSSLFDEAKRREILGLIERGTFRVVLAEEVGPNPNVVLSRFVLTIKHGKSGEEVYKARLVLGGHRDKDKRKVVHNSYNLKQSSIRLILALATILGFDIWSLDVKQAYLQSASTLRRKVFTKAYQVELGPDELLQIIKPLYGLTDSGDYWCETNTRFHIQKLLMGQSTGDFALFFRRAVDKLLSLSGSYVDDILQAGTPDEKKRIRSQFKRGFDVKFSDGDTFVYTDLTLDKSNSRLRTLSQEQYIKRLKFLRVQSSYSEFRSLRAKLAWVVQTRPDIACAVSMSAQVTEKTHSTSDNVALNSFIKHLRATCHLHLQFPKLDPSSLRLLVYCDASHNNREGHRSQLGYLILLADKGNRCAFLHYSSRKSTRVTRSSMAGETLAFVDGFDQAFLIRHDVSRLMGRDIPLLMLTDSEQLFEILTRSRYTTERRLMIDISTAREAYNEKLIANVALIHSEFNYVDGLTKIKSNGALLELLRKHQVSHPARQWVIQPDQVLSESSSDMKSRGVL